jgi:hypothetical protein
MDFSMYLFVFIIVIKKRQGQVSQKKIQDKEHLEDIKGAQSRQDLHQDTFR